ncbi:ShlB/FhaC/HecB family hemolysin secretion/activation protein, partial [Enterobacter asburiae]|nr:ShlB/FhaC/HecB family hemolysin secretion/activation protein [Enterobacter asburiae]
MRYYSKAVFFCSLFFCSLSHAAPLTPADRDTVRQQQEELLLKNQQQREELERSIPRPAPARTLPAAGTGPCFTIDTITLSGTTLISPKTRQTLVAPWQGRCLDMAKITELLARISDWYISRG